MTPADKSTGHQTIVRSLLGLPRRDSGLLHGCTAAPPSPFRFSPEKTAGTATDTGAASPAIGHAPSAPDPVPPTATGSLPRPQPPADESNAARHIIRPAQPAPSRVAPDDTLPLAATKMSKSVPSADTTAHGGTERDAAADFRHPDAQPRRGRNSSLSQSAPATDTISPPAFRADGDSDRPQPFAGAPRLTENQGNPRREDEVTGPAPADHHSPRIRRHDGNASFVAMKQSKTVHDAAAERRTVTNLAAEILPPRPVPFPFPPNEKLTDSAGLPVTPFPHQQERPMDNQVMQLRHGFHALMSKQALVREENQAKQTAESFRPEDETNSPPPLHQVVIIKQTTKSNGSGLPAAFWERSYMSHLTLRTIR